MVETFLPNSPDSPDRIEIPKDYSGDFIGDEDLGKNPDKDMHTITAQTMYPNYFKDKPKYEWVCIANHSTKFNAPIRKLAKLVSFGIIYMQAASTLAALHKIKEKDAEKMIKAFNNKYRIFYEWQQTMAALGAARGWIKDGLGRWRWCLETNSKGKDNSANRLAVNMLIQLVSH